LWKSDGFKIIVSKNLAKKFGLRLGQKKKKKKKKTYVLFHQKLILYEIINNDMP
jgi:hypothetical protein